MIRQVISKVKTFWGQIREPNFKSDFRGFYKQFIRPNDLCFDVGAHLGKRTDLFLELGARVVCVEPQPALVAALEQKYNRNPRVTILPLGLGDHSGHALLSLCSSADTIATFSPKWMTGRFKGYQWDTQAEVKLTTLDALIQQFGIPAFVKIDVEGFEHSVLQGLFAPVPALSFEFTKEFRDDAESCMEILEGLGMDQFNFALGEEPRLLHSEWTDATVVLEMLHQSEDPLLWGDIYARESSAGP